MHGVSLDCFEAFVIEIVADALCSFGSRACHEVFRVQRTEVYARGIIIQ